MLHIAVILYDDKRMFSRINVKCELTCLLSKLCYIFVNNVWSGTGSTRRLKQTIEIKAPPERVFALNPVQLCRQVCTLFLLNFINGGRKKRDVAGDQEPVVLSGWEVFVSVLSREENYKYSDGRLSRIQILPQANSEREGLRKLRLCCDLGLNGSG